MESQYNGCVFKIDEVVQANQYLNLYENVSYQIKFQTEQQKNNGTSSELYRSYSHFEWLAKNLMEQYEGIIVPQIPGKNPFAKLKLIDSQTRSIREQRKIGLEEFLKKIVAHPSLQTSEYLKNFLDFSEKVFQRFLLSSKEINDLRQNKLGQLYQSISQNHIVKSGIQKTLNVFSLFLNSEKTLHQQQEKLQILEYDISTDDDNLFKEEQQILQSLDIYLNNVIDLLKQFTDSKQSVVNNSSQIAQNVGMLQNELENQDIQEESKDQEIIIYKIQHNIPKIIEREIQVSSLNLNQLYYIVYALEMYSLDIKYGLSVVDKKDEIQSEIKQTIVRINSGGETVETVQNLSLQLSVLKDRLFKINKYFKKNTEEGINDLVISFNKIHFKILQVMQNEMNESEQNSQNF